MKVHYGNSAGFADALPDNKRECGVQEVLAIFRGLDPRRGFLGVSVGESKSLQLCIDRAQVMLELVSSDVGRIEWCYVTPAQAEQFIEMADRGEDVFARARQSLQGWEQYDLRPRPSRTGKLT